MALFENFPWTNLHQLNLNWLIEEVKKCYSPDNPPEAMVISVNGESGIVTLYKDAHVALPDITEEQWNLYRGSANKITGIEFNKDAAATRINGNQRFVIYDAGNPPPYPVIAVNGETGDVILYEDPYVVFPDIEGNNWGLERKLNTDTADETRIGIMFDDNGKAYITHDEDATQILTMEDIPSSSGVVSINGKAGVVNLSGADIPINENDSTTINSKIINIQTTLTQHETNISQNAENITQNAEDITQNAEDIAQNAEDIAQNATNIFNLKNELTIIINGNTSEKAIHTNDYVFVVNSTINNITDGIYKANTNINANTPVTSANLTKTDLTDGALNTIARNIATLYDNGSWTPTFGRDTATYLYASWIRVGNLLFITAQWVNSNNQGYSYIDANSLPTPTGYRRNYGFHGTWRSAQTDNAGEIGQYSENDSLRFSRNGISASLPNERISFNAICFLQKTN